MTNTSGTAAPGTPGRFGARSAMVKPFRDSREASFGAILAVGMLALIIAGPLFAPFSPTTIGVGEVAEGPSGIHWLGTDSLGRDVWSRFLHGGRTVILLPFIGVTLAFLTGGLLGMAAAYFGGARERWLARCFDLILSFPSLLLLLILVAGLGASNATVIFAVWIAYLPRAALTLRAATRVIVRSDYVTAAKARGERWWWIFLHELFPNVTGPVLADYALRVTYGVIFVATLSYLGIGAQPPSSDWGLLISEYQQIMLINPSAVIVPGIGIAALSVSLNLIADALSQHYRRG